MAVIKTSGLTKYYGTSRGIIDVNLEVKEGEFFGFIGPNGAGKSTMIRTILGLIKCSSGSVEVFGKDLMNEKKEILKDIGYLPSEAMFYSGMKVKDVISLSANLRKKDCKKEADILCERLQLDITKKIEELSFGNRKKVGIVCSLLHNPKLCILDEPTSGLDPLMQREFFDILREKNEKGATIFLSSHILSEVQNYCTRAAIIKEGRIIACDSVEALAKTNAKRIRIQGDLDLSGFDGVRDYKKEEDKMDFLYGGDINSLIQELSGKRILDVTISEPDLEEIFMHYYEKEDA